LIPAGALAAADEEGLEQFEYLQIRMGVPVEIQVYAADESLANQAADAAYARLKQLDRIMSDYDPDSELMRLCAASRPGVPIEVSPDLAYILRRSLELSRQSNGAFDVTVGPVVDLWRVARRKQEPPDAARLQAALALVGYESLQLDEEALTVELLKPGMQIDLGGIAMGYAADEALRIFRAHGLTRVLIDASGDIVMGDPPPGRDHWRIEIEPLASSSVPTEAASPPAAPTPRLTLLLENCAVTTSGDAYKYIEFDGVRYSHIVDPKTGMGLTTRSSATIIAPDGITADSLATAVNALGPDRGLQLVSDTEGVEAYIEYADGDTIQSIQSDGFEVHLETLPEALNTLHRR
jgi:thiamine biosynthesis lipoprotein